MKNKHKLKRKRIFIKNDLSWKGKFKKKLNKWAREQRGKGKEVKGLGRVRVEGA